MKFYGNKIVHNSMIFVKLFSLTNLVGCTFCRVNNIRTEHDQHKFRIMEDVRGLFNHEEEIKGMYVHMGNEGTNSNGHGEGKEESMNLVETIKRLQRDVLSHKADNGRLMKSKEKQEDSNIKLMLNLDIIDKKMDKHTESRKSGSYKSHDKRGRSVRIRSDGRRYHHSPRHSTRRLRSSSSPIKKPNKRSGVDEL
jgi:hypothetical protein